MDHHLRFGLCVLYDAADTAVYVLDRRTVKKAHAQYVWRQVDKHDGHTTAYHYLPLPHARYYVKASHRKSTEKKKAGE